MMAMMMITHLASIAWVVAHYSSLTHAFTVTPFPSRTTSSTFLFQSQRPSSEPTELPDSLDDAATLAATACAEFAAAAAAGGTLARCRVDFDTSAGDETYSILKTSTEFMQKFVTDLTYLMLPALQQQRQDEMMKVVQAKVELNQLIRQQQQQAQQQQVQQQQQLQSQQQQNDDDEKETSETTAVATEVDSKTKDDDRETDLRELIANGGRDSTNSNQSRNYQGPKVRMYFPDEGNAALARRDWISSSLVPTSGGVVEFSSCGGIQKLDVSQDLLVFFFCPRASESDDVERLLLRTETESTKLQLVVFVNPNLVDMGVTGFGLAGRLLRERLIDALTYTYYLRTLPWGALTRVWPRSFSVWQQDVQAPGGYRLLKSLDQLPANPLVEDIYDEANGLKVANKQENNMGGLLDQLGDFVNGMMKL